MWTVRLHQQNYCFSQCTTMERGLKYFIVVVYMWLIDERLHTWLTDAYIYRHCHCVRMDDYSCVMKYIEIVPRDQFEDCSDVADVKCEPLFIVKVGVISSFCFTYLVYMHICAGILFYLLLFYCCCVEFTLICYSTVWHNNTTLFLFHTICLY